MTPTTRMRRNIPRSIGQQARRRFPTEPDGTLAYPTVNSEALSGEYFTRSARNRRLNLTWGQLDLFEGHADLYTVADLPQRPRSWARRVFTGACNGLYQVKATHPGDHFGGTTCLEALYVEEMQTILVYLAGDVEDVVPIVLDAYALQDVSSLSFVPVGRGIFPHRLEWSMATQMCRVFIYDDYLLTRQSRSERALDQYNDIHPLTSVGLSVYIGIHSSAPGIITTGVPVPGGFAIIPLFVLRNYAGAASSWRADRAVTERARTGNRVQRFELAVLCEYELALIRTAAFELDQNFRVPVWPEAVIAFLRGLRNFFPASDERAVNFWSSLFHSKILNLERALKAPTERHIRETSPLSNATIEWVKITELAVPDAISEVESNYPSRPPPAASPAPIIVEAPPQVVDV